MDKENNSKKIIDNYARYSTLALQMLVIILLGVFGGVQLDKLTHWKFPVFTVVFSLLSVILAIYYATKDLLKKKNGNK